VTFNAAKSFVPVAFNANWCPLSQIHSNFAEPTRRALSEHVGQATVSDGDFVPGVDAVSAPGCVYAETFADGFFRACGSS
jgi:hypothetical protein